MAGRDLLTKRNVPNKTKQNSVPVYQLTRRTAYLHIHDAPYIV